MADVSQVRTVAIIGAGVAGLATARVLVQQGHHCTVFERASAVGGVWAIGYANFGVQVQHELYEFPDWPLPEDTPDFTPGPIIQKYLADYADHFAITPHIRLEASVTSVNERAGPRSGWTVTWHGREGEQQGDFDLVVVCIGLYSHLPHMPEFPSQESFAGEIMHASGLKSRDQLAGKRVGVLGFGKSGTDAALEAATVAAETHIIFREPHWPVPPVLAGILPFKWAMLNRLASALIPLYQHPTGVERVVHSIGKPLVWFYWRLVELLLYVQCRLGSRFGTRVSLVPKGRVEIDAFGESTMLPNSEFYRAVRAGGINAHRTEIAKYTPTGVVLKDGQSLEIDTMILATGWRTDFGFLSAEVWDRLSAEDDGFYLYRHMLHPKTPGLVFVGRAATICSILTYSLQARWLGERLRGGFDLPTSDEMQREINAMRAWKQAWMPFSRARSARLIVHMQHYHDELLRDLGVSPLRKHGPFAPLAELIGPYEPADYATIVSGDWKT